MPHGAQADPNRPDRAYLRRLLSDRNQHPERIPQIDDEVRRAFGRKVAILVLDMCGFSRTTAEHGIIHFLAMVQQMEDGARPAIRSNGGQVIKQEADNLFAVFPDPARALEAVLDVRRAFEAMNAVVPEHRDIYGSFGIGFGDTLVIGDEDLFGAEMNLASKLGEDVACRMEILLTPAAHDALPPGRYVCVRDTVALCGMDVPFYRYESCLYPRPA